MQPLSHRAGSGRTTPVASANPEGNTNWTNDPDGHELAVRAAQPHRLLRLPGFTQYDWCGFVAFVEFVFPRFLAFPEISRTRSFAGRPLNQL